MQTKKKTDYRLNKTDYLQYLKCPQEFWLKVNEPLMAVAEITLEHEHLRQQGYAVEQMVKQLDRFQPDPARIVDFQRTFQTAELSARSDVVVTDTTTNEIDIFEVKSSSSVKEEHYDDVAFQRLAHQGSFRRQTQPQA